MSKLIVVQPSEVWDAYLTDEGPYLQSHEKEIAENQEYGAVIYLSEENGHPQIRVYLDDALVYEEICYTKEKCEQVCNMVYEEYLTEKVVNHASGHTPTITSALKDGPDAPLNKRAEQMEIDAREEELQEAFCEFLAVLIDQDIYDPVMVEDVLDHTIEYMARKYDISIYRPMYLEDKDGEFFEEDPYECMEYDDPDNPLYQQ